MRKDDGFTLIEMLTAVGLAAILMTLAAVALRQYWLVRSLGAATGGVVAQLRTLQQHAVSESSPSLFGASFIPDSGAWSTFRYNLGPDIASTSDDTCAIRSTLTLGTGVMVLSSTSFASASQVSQSVLASGCGIPSSAKVVLFFPKGTATRGHVDLHQPTLGRSAAVCVSPLTSRVSKSAIEASTSC